MKIIALAIPFVLLLTFSSCFQESVTGFGKIEEQKREVNDFTGVAININAKVEITGSVEPFFTVIAQENLINEIVSRVDGNVLVVTSKVNIVQSEPIIIKIGLRYAELVELNGSGTLVSTNILKGKFIDTEVSGSGSMNLDVEMDLITTMISGSGKIILSGKSDSFKSQTNGSGIVDGSNLESNECFVTVNGSGQTHVFANKSLTVNINGSGEVYYSGTPEIKKTISGSGSVFMN